MNCRLPGQPNVTHIRPGVLSPPLLRSHFCDLWISCYWYRGLSYLLLSYPCSSRTTFWPWNMTNKGSRICQGVLAGLGTWAAS